VLVTITLTAVIAEVFSGATETELAAAYVQWAFRSRVRSILSTLGCGFTLAQTSLAAVGGAISILAMDQHSVTIVCHPCITYPQYPDAPQQAPFEQGALALQE
jgi:hypothetical protein